MNEHLRAQLLARDTDGHVVVCPCLAFTLYLDETPKDMVLRFYERALAAVEPNLTHYMAENMRGFRKTTSRALSMVPTWIRKPSETHEYWIELYGDGVEEVSPWSISVHYIHVEPDAERRARTPKFLAEGEKRTLDGQPELPTTMLRVTVPVDSDLARPDTWLAWVLGFDLVTNGEFLLGESGYSLNREWGSTTSQFVQAACSRYPGLDWHAPAHRGFLQRYEASLDAVLPMPRRAAWLTMLHETAVRFLGGPEKLRVALAGTPDVRLHSLAHGLVFQAGPAPELGDLSRHEVPGPMKAVARVIRPARLRGVPGRQGFDPHWFNMFDEEHG